MATLVAGACGNTSTSVKCGSGTKLVGDECVVVKTDPSAAGEAGSPGHAGGAPSGGGAVALGGSAADGGGEPAAGGAGTEPVNEAGAAALGGQGAEAVGGEAGAAGQAGGEGGKGGEGGAAECPAGTEGCACIDQACDGSLVCRDDGCVSPPEPPQTIVAGHFELPPGPFDVALDWERKRLFASYGGDGVVRALDLDDGDITTVSTGHRAEHLFFDAARDEVLVSLAVGTHSAYWFDDQEGYIAAVDAVTLKDPKPIWIPLDPWQIVGDGRGHAIVSGASGQWTDMLSADLETGWYQSSYGPYDGTSIRIHPAGDRIYGADTGLSPSDIERYDLSTEGVVKSAYDSPYHGDYAMCGDLRIHPRGDTIYTRCGHIFLASNSRSTDMTWVASLGMSWVDLAFDGSGKYALVLASAARTLYVFDTETLEPATTVDVSPADRILSAPGYFLLVRQATHGAVPYTDVEVVLFNPKK